MIHSRAEMNQISNYLYPNRLKTLLLILYAIIRFQPFQFYSQTPCWKAIAAEGRKKHPLRELVVARGECFQRIQLFQT